MRNSFSLLIAVTALGAAAVVAAVWRDRAPELPSVSTQPRASVAGAADPVAGSGIVEAEGGLIIPAAPVAGIVTRVDAVWGAVVRAGDPLFALDDRDLQSARTVAQAEIDLATTAIEPTEQQLRITRALVDLHLATRQDVVARQQAVAVARATLQLARARLAAIEADRARRIVRAPVAGEILKVNIRPGDYVDPAAAGPAILLAGGHRLAVRAEFDEFDAWRVHPGDAAVASLPAMPGRRVALRFERIEPYVMGKIQLTGSSGERVDTRVLQVIYSFPPGAIPVYIGQRVDVTVTPGGQPDWQQVAP